MTKKTYLWWLGLLIMFLAMLKTGLTEPAGALWAIAGALTIIASALTKEAADGRSD